jgi:hypothetical protein
MRDGERQVAPDISGIRRDHVARYEWAARLLPAGSRVADLGCGVGYGSAVLAKSGHRVVGIDLDADAIAYARQHYAHDAVCFRRGDLRVLEVAEPHDAAVCFEVIEHLEDPRPMLRALHNVTSRLLVSAPNEAVFPWRNYAFHFRHYTKWELDDLLAETGWTVVAWHGQEDIESEVSSCEGRTLIADCSAGEMRAAPALRLYRPDPVPQRVAILGLGPSVSQYLTEAKAAGGRSAVYDAVWAINALGNVVECDLVFHMDDVRVQEIRARAAPQSNIASMLKWLREHPGPIITSRSQPAMPGLYDFPLEEVINATGIAYFNSTAAYAIAYAVLIGVGKLSLFGMDFTYPNAHDAEKGRACVEFWLGIAQARGIKLAVARSSTLLDACGPLKERLYGYDMVHVCIAGEQSGRTRVSFRDRDAAPSADEIEQRYDHGRHPNALVDDCAA